MNNTLVCSRLSFLALASSCLLAGCSASSPSSTPDSAAGQPTTAAPGSAATSSGLAGKLVVTGSSTVAPLASEIAKRFESLHPSVRVDVQTGGSSRGIRDAMRGVADIGMSSRALNESEKATLESHTIAWDGVCFLVHESNPVDKLSLDQLRAIFTGGVENWREVGGADAPVVVVNRAEGRSELVIVSKYLDVAVPDFAADQIAGENQHGLRSIAGNPNAITYLSLGASEMEAERGATIKLLPLAGAPATSAAVRSGDFPLARPLNLIVKRGGQSELAEQFLRFASSSQVADLVEGQAFVAIDQ